MDNKFNIDRMAYLIGQEDAIEELDKFTKPHEFSKKYEMEKMKMIKKENHIESIPMPNRTGRGMMKKKLIVLIAAITATLAISITAYGICRKIFVTTSRDEEAGTVTYNIDSESEITEIPLINITPQYLPESYLPLNGAPGKYSPNGKPSGEEGILIYQNDYIYQPESYNISNVAETTIGGVKAYINSSEGMLYKYKIDLIYEDDGQIISVGGTGDLEELKKVAENIKYEVVPGEFLKLYEQAIEKSDDVHVAPSVPANHVFNLGEEMTDEMLPDKNPTFALNKVEIMDKLPEVNQNYFWDYGKYPIYFDQSDYSGGHFFFCDLAPNETKEVHLIYLLDEDHLDDAYFTKSGMSVIGNGNENTNIFEGYVKIK